MTEPDDGWTVTIEREPTAGPLEICKYRVTVRFNGECIRSTSAAWLWSARWFARRTRRNYERNVRNLLTTITEPVTTQRKP